MVYFSIILENDDDCGGSISKPREMIKHLILFNEDLFFIMTSGEFHHPDLLY